MHLRCERRTTYPNMDGKLTHRLLQPPHDTPWCCHSCSKNSEAEIQNVELLSLVTLDDAHTERTRFTRNGYTHTGAPSIGLLMILSCIRFDELRPRMAAEFVAFNFFFYFNFRCHEFTILVPASASFVDVVVISEVFAIA